MREGFFLRSPEILDGRVKTLHPKVGSPFLSPCMQSVNRFCSEKMLQVHGGLLAARGNAGHEVRGDAEQILPWNDRGQKQSTLSVSVE